MNTHHPEIESLIGNYVIHRWTRIRMSALVTEDREVKLMAIADGYAMVRRPRCMPYVCRVRDLSAPSPRTFGMKIEA